jgi:hypothetical protein
MGTWGTPIFSDDTASDVRDEFRELIGEGLSTEQATDKLVSEYAPSLDDPDDGPPFWLGLAVTQWKCGRLLEQVKAKALDIIDTGADLKRWSGDPKRRAVLEKTRAQLLSPPPAPTPIRKRYQENNDWEVGELISYQTPRGKYAVLRVLGHATGSAGKHPIIELVDWYAASPASLDDARHLRRAWASKGRSAPMGSRIWRSSLLYRPATNLSRACIDSALLQRLSSTSIAAIHIGPGVISGTMWTRSSPVQSGCSLGQAAMHTRAGRLGTFFVTTPLMANACCSR